MKSFPILYQKTATGAIQRWEIRSEEADIHYGVDGSGPGFVVGVPVGVIVTIWGQVDGAQQETRDVIREGKNTSKVNATTAVEQAEKEAAARWTKQKKKGYVEDLEQARAGQVDASVILGGVPPMLAPNKCYPSDANLARKIAFPAFVQPKLDGVRCIATIVDGRATLWSRSRKRIRSVPHIVEALETAFGSQSITLDGELYNHDLKAEFEELISIVRKDEPDAEGRHRMMQYHVYDAVLPTAFERRLCLLRERWSAGPSAYPSDVLHLVQTHCVHSQPEALVLQDTFETEGYEGAMIRNAHGPYEQDKRSAHLQKMKSWLEAEFPIVGADEGRGKDAGSVGAFECMIDAAQGDQVAVGARAGASFRVRLKATYARRRELFADEVQWRGKRLTVRFKRYTADGVPYLPIGQGLREGF